VGRGKVKNVKEKKKKKKQRLSLLVGRKKGREKGGKD